MNCIFILNGYQWQRGSKLIIFYFFLRDLDKIDDMMQDITEQQDIAQEITEALTRKVGDDFDEVGHEINYEWCCLNISGIARGTHATPGESVVGVIPLLTKIFKS